MSNGNNPFYGNNWMNMSGTTNYDIPSNHNHQMNNLYFNPPNRFQSIPGRTVNNLDEITPQEVPMDGSVSLFPQNDYSAIYAKTWTKDGTIATVKFIPEQPQMESQKSPLEERLDRIDQRFDKLEKMLSNRNKPYRKPQKNKKEEDTSNV